MTLALIDQAFAAFLTILEDVEYPVDLEDRLSKPVQVLAAFHLELLAATGPKHQSEEEPILIACKLVLKDYEKGSYVKILDRMHPSASRIKNNEPLKTVTPRIINQRAY